MTSPTPIWIEDVDVLILHDRLLAIHGGAVGLRDEGLLQSAVARARQLAAYGENADMIAMAARYTAGIVKNHPFVDGDKRTGFVIGILFLELNGYRFTATEADAAEAVIALASGTLDETGYADFLRANVATE